MFSNVTPVKRKEKTFLTKRVTFKEFNMQRKRKEAESLYETGDMYMCFDDEVCIVIDNKQKKCLFIDCFDVVLLENFPLDAHPNKKFLGNVYFRASAKS